MLFYIVIIIVAAFAMGFCMALVLSKNNQERKPIVDDENGNVQNNNIHETQNQEQSNDLACIQFNEIPELSEDEIESMVEIEDPGLLSVIDRTIPGTFQAMEKSGMGFNRTQEYQSRNHSKKNSNKMII